LQLKQKKGGFFYGCSRWPDCNGYLGAMPDGFMSRGDAYRWLRRELKISKKEAKISRLSDKQCESLIELVYTRFPALHTRYTRLAFEDIL
jgi:ssDNA-binding Zn-finger/Zn-ribbon topoisomerase 1